MININHIQVGIEPCILFLGHRLYSSSLFHLINLLFPRYFQKDAMEDSVEIVIEKLLHVTKDVVPKVIVPVESIFF